MPPTDNNTPTSPAPAPAPTPEQPKQGFFAKLFSFGKKAKQETTLVPPHESHTPPPQLDDPTVPVEPQASADVNPSEGTAVTSPNGNPNGPELSRPVPTVSPEEQPPTLDVPDSLKAKPIDVDEANVSPTLPTQEPAAGSQPNATAPGVPPIGSPANPEPGPTQDAEQEKQ